MLKIDNCLERQKRLLEWMEKEALDLAILSNPKTVYYFSGSLVNPSLPQAFLLNSDGRSLLVTNGPAGSPAEPPPCAASAVRFYTWHTIERDVCASSWSCEMTDLVQEGMQHLRPAKGSFGLEFESASYQLGELVRQRATGELRNLTPPIDLMRRQKDPDEIESIRRTVQLVEAALAAVKAKLEPGMTEYKAYSIYYEAMVAKAQTSVVLNGDFACGLRAIRGGGPPTNRRTQHGDLYIFDTFPIYEGYMCDFTRTFAVGRPTQLQQDAWGHVMEAHAIARKIIQIGVPSKEVYHALKNHLDKFELAKGSFWHHAGHGVGMSGWEFPWLTPGSDDVIQDREVLACEPALYDERLGGGIRLEHDYLVTTEGVTALDHFPMELV